MEQRLDLKHKILYCFHIFPTFLISFNFKEEELCVSYFYYFVSFFVFNPKRFNCYFAKHCRCCLLIIRWNFKNTFSIQARSTFPVLFFRFLCVSARRHLRLFTFSNCFWESSRAIETQTEDVRDFFRFKHQHHCASEHTGGFASGWIDGRGIHERGLKLFTYSRHMWALPCCSCFV